MSRDAEGPGFEALVKELEETVRALERDEMDLDEALALFESGVRRLREAGRLLDEARGRVEELIETASGDLETLGWEEDPEGADGPGDGS
ncbi:MAG: exodeoxyribonuclease VII small subunit [Gemmatimonadota bacterium]|nr:exodeoxyribonuclease VII small subunit [Gemmatimonadota bacterium]